MKTKLRYLLASIIVIATIVACTVPQVVTSPDGTTATNQVVDPKFDNLIATAEAMNQASAQVNPWWPIVSAALAAVGAVATAVAKVKSDGKNSLQGQLVSVIRAVDDSGDDKLKAAIQARAESDGTESALHKTVKQVGAGAL